MVLYKSVKSHLKKVTKLLFGKHLLATNIAVSGVLLGLGDGLVQNLDKFKGHAHDYDWKRTGRLTVVGLTLSGPLNHVWYTLLDLVLPGKKVKIILKKTLADQIIAAPVFCFSFFMGTGILEGQTAKSSFGEFRRKFWSVYKADWVYWPAAQSINFVFVPTKLRVLYVAFATLLWNCYLAYRKHEDSIRVES